nr:hypothetical protein [uncultured Draconibacterium sp.]
MPSECKIYNNEESIIGDDYEIKTLFIDVDKISAFHEGEHHTTMVYCDGTVYELTMPIDKFTKLKLSDTLTPPAKDRFVTMFSNN